jgi:hypothetical protein
MSFFLFAKQFVDMLYPHQILDYLMVILVVILLVYQTALVRPDIRSHFGITDGIILLLGILLTVTLFRSQGGYQTYFKVMSAFLMYFVGRIYYDRIKECYSALTLASYLIVYLNFGHRIWNFRGHLLQIKDAGGDWYYNDTDMAFAIVLAMVFIAMFAKNTIFKLVTIFLICPYMVFYSDAGIQMVLMIAVYVIIGIYILELIIRNRKVTGVLLSIMVLGLLGIVVLVYAPVLGIGQQEGILNLFTGRFLDQGNMYSRYVDWDQVLTRCRQEHLLTQVWGVGMGAEYSIQSLYLKIYYTLGYVGIGLSLLTIISILYYVMRVEDRKTFYLAVILAILLLGSGVTVNSMESTQMSWFPMLFAGMVISSVQAGEGERKC